MAKSTPASQQRAEQERRAAEEAAKEQRRSELRGQIGNLNLQITTYDNQISSLKSKLTSQRAMKTLFDGKSVDLDTEKAAKSVYTQNVSQYVDYQKFAYGYTEVMNDYTGGGTAQTYQNYSTETSQFMQMEIDENQTKLEELQRARNSSASAVVDLSAQLAMV